MGNFFKKIDKAAGKLIGIDKDAAKDAANKQAAATREASERVARDAAFAVQAGQQQIEATAAQEAARAKAKDLLGRPMENAEVDMTETGDIAEDDTDLLGRKRGGIRQTYRQSASNANSGLVL